MFKNYFKIALRYFLRQKFYSFINIAGLALLTVAFQSYRAALANPAETLRQET